MRIRSKSNVYRAIYEGIRDTSIKRTTGRSDKVLNNVFFENRRRTESLGNWFGVSWKRKGWTSDSMNLKHKSCCFQDRLHHSIKKINNIFRLRDTWKTLWWVIKPTICLTLFRSSADIFFIKYSEFSVSAFVHSARYGYINCILVTTRLKCRKEETLFITRIADTLSNMRVYSPHCKNINVTMCSSAQPIPKTFVLSISFTLLQLLISLNLFCGRLHVKL